MITILSLLVALGLANVAGAADLWDQTAGYESWQMGYFNVIAGGPPFGATMYTVNDIVVGAGGWNVDAVHIYYDGFDASWAGALTSAVLYVEPKTGSLPTGDPSTGVSVAVTATTLGNGFLELSATGLGLALAEGEYWIGLTPVAPNANNIHVSVAAVGDDSPTYDAFGFPVPMWGAWNVGLDGAMLIQGELGAVATDDVNLGTLKALYR
jgi:hypothetical protein